MNEDEQVPGWQVKLGTWSAWCGLIGPPEPGGSRSVGLKLVKPASDPRPEWTPADGESEETLVRLSVPATRALLDVFGAVLDDDVDLRMRQLRWSLILVGFLLGILATGLLVLVAAIMLKGEA